MACLRAQVTWLLSGLAGSPIPNIMAVTAMAVYLHGPDSLTLATLLQRTAKLSSFNAQAERTDLLASKTSGMQACEQQDKHAAALP